MSFISGDVVLENLVLKQNALEELNIPVQTVYGHLGKCIWKISTCYVCLLLKIYIYIMRVKLNGNIETSNDIMLYILFIFCIIVFLTAVAL